MNSVAISMIAERIVPEIDSNQLVNALRAHIGRHMDKDDWKSRAVKSKKYGRHFRQGFGEKTGRVTGVDAEALHFLQSVAEMEDFGLIGEVPTPSKAVIDWLSKFVPAVPPTK